MSAKADPLLHERHPVRVLLRRARRHAWDDAVTDAAARGLLDTDGLAQMLASNPWREGR